MFPSSVQEVERSCFLLPWLHLTGTSIMDIQFLNIEMSQVAVQSSWLRLSSSLRSYSEVQQELIQGGSLQLQCFSFSLLCSQPPPLSLLQTLELPPVVCQPHFASKMLA